MQTVPRLYESFQPTHYKLSLKLKRTERTFSGNVVVTGNRLSTHGSIKLHVKDLTIVQVYVNEKIANHTVIDKEDALEISPTETAGGDVRIAIDFNGTITDAMHGLYPCYYEVDGVKKELLATQFESHHAREVFPCVDEPEAKATFDLTLQTEQDVTVLGNMPVKDQSSDADGLVTTFETSPKMSSYLLAFVVGELQAARTTTKDGVEVAVWATKAQPVESLAFSLDVAKRSIEFFNDYFNEPYPLPKCDHVALPDFSSGAMENWGLITYREICLVVDENTAISTREYVATVIAHETSHQWFGNLVTMKWWDDLWLNESFATLMEYLCVDALFPTWNIWMNFATHEVLSAQRRDYLPGIQAIKTEVNHPDEISTLFDASIVYAKGARVLAMLRQYIGDEAFQTGLKHYFNTYPYQNTTANDLWNSLSNETHPDLAVFMKPWLEQSGMPKVRASVSGRTIQLSQSRFLIPTDTSDTQTWPIPLMTVPADLSLLLDVHSAEVTDPGKAIWLNHNATTHMVSDYDDELRARLYEALDSGKASEIDRLTLLHDTSLVMREGSQSAINTLELARHYKQEISEPVWDIISLVVADLRRLVDSDEQAEKCLKFASGDIARGNFERLGWSTKPNESEDDTKLRATVIAMLVYAEDDQVVSEGLKLFRSATKLESLEGELRSLIFSVAVKHGSDADRQRLLDLHGSTASSELQSDIAGALCSSRDVAFIIKLISFLKDEEKVRRQDLFRWFYSLMSNKFARNSMWQWFTDNWAWIVSTYGGDKSYDDFARYSAAALTTPEWLDNYKQFFADKRDIPALKRAIELGIADISARAQWYERDAEPFCEWLKRSATK